MEVSQCKFSDFHDNAVFILVEFRNEKIFQSVRRTCIRNFRERIQFSIHFMRAPFGRRTKLPKRNAVSSEGFTDAH